MAVFSVFWSCLLTPKLSCLQKNKSGHTKEKLNCRFCNWQSSYNCFDFGWKIWSLCILCNSLPLYSWTVSHSNQEQCSGSKFNGCKVFSFCVLAKRRSTLGIILLGCLKTYALSFYKSESFQSGRFGPDHKQLFTTEFHILNHVCTMIFLHNINRLCK